jgi:glycosyltransferase involved in cell wall biosynthesis
VIVLPTLPDYEVRQWLSTCSIGVLPSRYEGFGMAFLELMGSGLPIVGTPTGGMPDVITTGVDGVIVPIGDADLLAKTLLGLLRDRALRTEMGRAAWLTARRHNWREVGESMAAHYRNIRMEPSPAGLPNV